MTMSPAPAAPAAFALSFLAPPVLDGDFDAFDEEPRFPAHSAPSVKNAGDVRWHPKAKVAAGQMGISETQVAEALASPDDVQPDARDPKCMLFRRGKLTVVTGREGLVIAVRRR